MPIDGMPARVKRVLHSWLIPFVVYFAAALFATRPLASAGADHIISRLSPEDVLHQIWILGWDMHALTTDPGKLFQANILYPARDVLAYSDHMLGALPLFAPLWLLTGNPLLAFNGVTFAGFLLSALFMHLLIRRWTGSPLAAYVAGVSFAFAPWRLVNFHWPHLLSVQYLPLLLLALDRAALTGRVGIGLLAAAILTLQALCSSTLAYMTFVLAGSYLLADAIVRGFRGRQKAWLALAVGTLTPMLVLVPLSIPYLRARDLGTLSNAPNFIADLAKVTTFRWVLAAHVGWEAVAVIGLFALLSLHRGQQTSSTGRVRALSAMIAFVSALAIAMGPSGGWLSPYSWMASIVPGFRLFRIPSRFGILAAFAGSVLAGLAVASLTSSFDRQRHRVLWLLVGIVSLGVISRPLWSSAPTRTFPLPAGAAVPSVYRWLAAHGDGRPLLELPATTVGVTALTKEGFAEALAVYFSGYHWLPLLNGYTSYIPNSYRLLRAYAIRLPDTDALQVLVDCTGLRWLLFHGMKPEDEPRWANSPGLTLRSAFQSDGREERLYEVGLSPRSACPLPLQ
ncbi:MAG: hypothetical protein ACRERC_22805 [Candidatus Binatia bacterium]